MTTIARRVDDDVRRGRNDDKTMATVRLAGRIRRHRRNGSRPIGVGDEGRQGGGVGRESWGRIVRTNHRGVRVTGFFWQHDVLACTVNNSPRKYGTPTM